MKILLFSTLYPNSVQPLHALFVEQRALQLRRDYPDVELQVVAPVPWFPFASQRFGRYGEFARIPRVEERSGIRIHHPRYPVVPKIGMSWAPALMARCSRACLQQVQDSGFDFDLIDAHFLYPDGLAALKLGKAFNKPVVITARGSDVMFHQTFKKPAHQTRDALPQADALIVVADALRQHLLGLGYTLPETHVLRNGVDLSRFSPQPSAQEIREELGIKGHLLISVGRLAELKGHELTIEALVSLPGVSLMLVGDGPEESALKALAERLGVADRVFFLGGKPQQELARFISAADIKVLASSREGWPNVLLEAMACGTPVVATAVGGVPEVLSAGSGGVLVEDRSAAGLAAAIGRLLTDMPDRASVRAYAERFDWSETSRGQYELFQRLIKAAD
ncbi:glycosyltransferase family 4 protein [Pseudomaricurvus alcaniphilus]|uniref:glycosyltransferase family 4 protein n=1 Tax=Pseudomaricurvus alcaniphilus TaxID=1166482 RepID=UPI001408D1C4|nr:glycosyltransferase family 4 protein [Pseudomaricurvus alcaniphilus]NHN36702.1 glycosyltransferase family 4 protein [Pseudomaricurvus alcaniphilus]